MGVDLNHYTEQHKKAFYEAVELAARVQDFIDYDGPDRTAYDEEQEGDARFVKPIPPEGWGYDDETGSFYPLNPPDPEPVPETVTTDEFTAAYNEGRDSV